MKRKYYLLIYLFLFECIILLVFNLKSSRTLRLFTKQKENLTVHIDHNNSRDFKYKCEKYPVESDNEIGLKYYRENARRFIPEFNKCYEKESASSLIRIKSFPNETYLIEIDYTKLITRFEIENLAQVKCHADLFDKKVNESERISNLKTIAMFKIRNFSLVLQQNGFYHIYCKKNHKIFFQDVRLVLPNNMRLLKEKTKKYTENLNSMKDDFLKYDSTSNPMLDDLELITNKECQREKNLNETKMNVLILGIDSLSYPHMKRSLPRFYEYISKNLENNIIFENFNKVGENTYPNLLALFSGVKIEPFYESNITQVDIDFFMKLDSTNHDLIPFVWKSYHELDYLSMYNEEWSIFGCFNYLKNGFRWFPSDYYSMPFWTYYDKISMESNFSRLCLNNEPTYTASFEKIKQLFEKMNLNVNKNIPYFSFNFFKYYTHDYLVTPTGFDAELTSLVRKFEQNGNLDNTLLIIMSDHGSRLSHYGYYTDPGRLERSMPFLSVRLPKQLRNTQFEINLKKNQNKLVSMFDLYKTLKHFYYLNKYDVETLMQNSLCRYNFTYSVSDVRSMRGISLFENINEERMCIDALVPNSYCLCSSKEKLNETIYLKETNYTFNFTSEHLTNFVNSLTKEFRSKCELFQFDRIKSVKKVSYTPNIQLYNFEFILQPGKCVFEANVRIIGHKLEIYDNKVNRLSVYRNQSKCIETSQTRPLMPYCFCK